jgi:hypothetical protein
VTARVQHPTGTSAPSIGRFAVTWRTDGEPDRRRLDLLIGSLLDGPLDDALRGGPDDEVCVRAVSVPPYRIVWGATDADVVTGWSQAIAAAVAQQARAGDAVRYPSRAHAAIDLVGSVLAGDLTRAWAWHLLDLWPGGADGDVAAGPGDAALGELVAGVLSAYPTLVVPALVQAADAGRLDRLVRLVGTAGLADLVGRAWAAAGGGEPPGRLAVPPATEEDIRAAAPILAQSHLLAAAAGSIAGMATGTADPPGSAGAAGPPAVAALPRTLAAAAVLEVEPARAARPDALAVVDALAGRLAADGGRAHDPGVARHDATRARPAGAPDRDPGNARRPAGAPASPGTGADPSPPARTGWGGLLFLLPVLEAIGVPDRLAEDPVPSARGLLHQLGRDLLTRAAPDAVTSPRDPAALAFCGLPPGGEPPPVPGADDPARRRLAMETVGREADRVVAALRARLDATRRPDAAVLLAVCRRRAVVEAAPGWIDVLLDLDELSVEVRRAGLDLDPGYLPWLGCVVRFRYG